MPTPFDDFVARLESERKSEPLVSLSVKVPLSIATAIEELILQVRSRGFVISKTRIVVDALTRYLGLSKPATQPPPESPES